MAQRVKLEGTREQRDARRRELKKKQQRKKPDPPNRLRLTQAKIDDPQTKDLKPGAAQYQVWDSGTGAQRGLSILVNTGGSKLYRVTYKFNGKVFSEKLGRTDEVSLDKARAMAKEKWEQAFDGIDPKIETIKAGELYEDVVGRFIKLYAEPNQRSWQLTKGVLERTCGEWMKKRFAKITKADALALLDKIKNTEGKSGKPQVYKGAVAYAWIKKLWKWAAERDYIKTNPMANLPFKYEKRRRIGVFDDDTIKAIWAATSKLSKEEAAYLKLLVLLAPRKSALASTNYADLKVSTDKRANEKIPVWVTPFELTKSRKTAEHRTYVTPLPELAQRILSTLSKQDGTDRIFPSLPESPGKEFKDVLVKAGVPKHFTFHMARHTVTSWLEEQGHNEYERGLILNHKSTGVTAGYSHGDTLRLKLRMLEEWCQHVERLVTPAGTTLLRG
jgi:integrase